MPFHPHKKQEPLLASLLSLSHALTCSLGNIYFSAGGIIMFDLAALR